MKNLLFGNFHIHKGNICNYIKNFLYSAVLLSAVLLSVSSLTIFVQYKQTAILQLKPAERNIVIADNDNGVTYVII